MDTSTSHDHALGIHHHRTEEMEKSMDEEDHFHKTIMQKKPKLDLKVHKSTPTVVQACDSKRPEQFHRGVLFVIFKNFLYITNILIYFFFVIS